MSISCNGDVSTNYDGIAVCTGEWVVEPDQLTELYVLLNSVFSTPPAVDIQVAFMAGCTIPLICYMSAWGYQTLINFISRD